MSSFNGFVSSELTAIRSMLVMILGSTRNKAILDDVSRLTSKTIPINRKLGVDERVNDVLQDIVDSATHLYSLNLAEAEKKYYG